MGKVVVRYKVKPERVEENERLIGAVYAELAESAPEGLRYATFRLDDGVSFVHIASIDTADGSNPLRGDRGLRRVRSRHRRALRRAAGRAGLAARRFVRLLHVVSGGRDPRPVALPGAAGGRPGRARRRGERVRLGASHPDAGAAQRGCGGPGRRRARRRRRVHRRRAQLGAGRRLPAGRRPLAAHGRPARLGRSRGRRERRTGGCT